MTLTPFVYVDDESLGREKLSDRDGATTPGNSASSRDRNWKSDIYQLIAQDRIPDLRTDVASIVPPKSEFVPCTRVSNVVLPVRGPRSFLIHRNYTLLRLFTPP